MSSVYLNHCEDCRRYVYVTLLEIDGAWRYLCGRCLRARRQTVNATVNRRLPNGEEKG